MSASIGSPSAIARQDGTSFSAIPYYRTYIDLLKRNAEADRSNVLAHEEVIGGLFNLAQFGEAGIAWNDVADDVRFVEANGLVGQDELSQHKTALSNAMAAPYRVPEDAE